MAREENLFEEKAKEEGGKPATNTDKLKALRTAMDKTEKNYGKGSIMKLGDENIEDVEMIPTDSIALNVALGVGGYPKGRIVEIYGPESFDRATIAIHAVAETQKKGGIAAFIDVGHVFDRFYAKRLGIDIENLWISQPDNGEQALEIAEQSIRSSTVDIIVIDSVAALAPKAEIEGDIGDSKMSLQARLMSQALHKSTTTINKTSTTCILINQLRDKIDVMFRNPGTTTGGNALKFYVSTCSDTRSIGRLKDDDEIEGNQVRVRVIKNRVAPPSRKAESDIVFGQSVSRSEGIVDLGSELNIIKKSGSWYSYNNTKLGQDRDTAKQCVKGSPKLTGELSELMFEALKASK